VACSVLSWTVDSVAGESQNISEELWKMSETLFELIPMAKLIPIASLVNGADNVVYLEKF